MSTRQQKARMRRAYLKHRATRVDKVGYQTLMAEAQARVNFESKYALSLFGLRAGDVMSADANKDRIDPFRKLLAEVPLINHIALHNGTTTKVLLFWTKGKDIDKHWFIIQRNVDSGETKKSKRYFDRGQALYDFKEDQVTWVSTVFIQNSI